MNFEEHTTHTPTYHDDHFQLGEQIFRQPIVFGNDTVQTLPEKPWQEWQENDFQAAISAGANLILLGTGKQQHFLAAPIRAKLSAKGTSVECMNTAAACRTLMLLHSEGRKVWAYLFL